MVWECAVDSSGSRWDPVRTVNRDKLTFKIHRTGVQPFYDNGPHPLL